MQKEIYIKKIIVVTVCQLIMTIGGAFLFCSQMGTDPFGLFVEAISKILNISYGTSNFVVSISIVIVCLIFYRKNISIVTIITMIVPGMVLDFYIAAINAMALPAFVVKFIYPFIGTLILGVFIACYLSMNVGASTIDNVVLWIADIIKGDYRRGYFVMCFACLVMGILLGATWGYATFVVFFCTGNVVKFMTPFWEKTIVKIIA